MYQRPFYRMWMVCALVCRELELTVWMMWRPCEVDVRCHPDVRGLNAALCGAYYDEQRCGCAVPDLEWGVIGGGFLCCQVKRSVLVRCPFGVDVWNFQEVRLIDAVVFKNWQWTVKCVFRWRFLSWILLSDCPCVGLGWMFTVYCRNSTRQRQKDIAPALISSLDNTRSRLLSHSTQDLGQRTRTVARHNKHHRAPRSTHRHLDDIEHLPYKDVTSPKQWVRAPYKRGHTPSTYDKRPLIRREIPSPRP